MMNHFLKPALGLLLLGAPVSLMNAEKIITSRPGYILPAGDVTPDHLDYARNAGLSIIELNQIEQLCDTLKSTDRQIGMILRDLKKTADDSKSIIWSIRMPASAQIDLSDSDESKRMAAVSYHKRLLSFVGILSPRTIIFTPSGYLKPGERQRHKEQLIKSLKELLPAVKQIKAALAVENMLGYDLLKDQNRENPLCRTLEETLEIFELLPPEIGISINMNNIRKPEEMIRSLPDRVTHVLISDGDGINECHYLPCSGEGVHDWGAVFRALRESGYRNPVIFDCRTNDIAAFPECYEKLNRP